MTSFRFFTVDAFVLQTGTGVFSGNPAGVVLVPKGEEVPAETMQNIAAEVNISETAFVTPLEDLPLEQVSRFGLRWFSPTVEIDLCGHGTLASAHIIFNSLQSTVPSVSFTTRSGLLTSHKNPTTGLTSISLPVNTPSPLASNLAGSPAFARLTSAILGDIKPASSHYADVLRLLVLHISGGESVLRSLKPNFKDILEWGDKAIPGSLGVIVTSEGDGDIDFVSRCFGPAIGVEEDPVTGSAHTILAPYWSPFIGKPTLRARQCSRRTGELHLTLNEKDGKVVLEGRSVTVVEGVFRI
ncbi:hypothetical protein BC936DRAFT_137817 [Jimgerdemannia flammicorona]|uniref:Uncharacterized protein n=1 Tax=Jimgerdemannia flammicorona TaxID=994334 RepID=A0A433CWM1_9FUNG|nr:hypothetical protein BC936DRAFT_137817 [Jimgerdemannia flammicorona]